MLLAVSGGIDSMVMLHVFRQSPYAFAVAHCNFQLRGKDSQLDEELVRQTAEQMDIPFYTKSFQTADYALQQGISIQMAARELRYEWLESARSAHGYDLIATAHHHDDSIETLFINLARGTGIEGLQGIPARNGRIIRPLLFASRNDMEAYAAHHRITYREDKSNNEDKYVRNKIRHHIIPVLKEINPSLNQTFTTFFGLTSQYNEIFRESLKHCQEACVSKSGDETHILIKPLTLCAGYASLLHAMLSAFGFSAVVSDDIARRLQGQPGKIFHAAKYSALIDRDKLIIYLKKDEHAAEAFTLGEDTAAVTTSTGQFFINVTDMPADHKPVWHTDHLTMMADADLLSFPLVLRRWNAGDKMQPLNLKGTKKISDLMVDKKIPLHRKNQVWLLTSNDQIVWATGLAFGDTFKVTERTKRIFTMKYLPYIDSDS